MPQNLPELSLALTLLRTIQGWSQKELAEAAGVQGNLLSDYERGRKPLSRERLAKLASTMGLSAEMIDQTLAFLRLVRVSSPAAGVPGDDQRRRIETVAADVASRTADFIRWALSRITIAARAEEERQDAQALWARLKTKKSPERRRLVEDAPRFRSWALCELVCHKSEESARDSADLALEFADLALRIAELIPGDDAWRSRVQGYAWAHVGNARRVRGDLPGADEAFHCAHRHWRVGEAVETNLLDEARLLDLEASLRREQRNFEEALNLLDRALTVDQGDRRLKILLKKATVLLALGDFEGSVAALRQATPLALPKGEPQSLFALRFNLAVNLCFLQRYREAEALLSEMRELATTLGNGLDLVRLRWLEGRIAGGLDDIEQAVTALSRVREEFTARGIAFDAALVSMELSILYLQEDRSVEVHALSRQMWWIFKAQGVPQNALAALRLFFEAAERDTVTLEWARKLFRYLHRAQYDPSLQFE